MISGSSRSIINPASGETIVSKYTECPGCSLLVDDDNIVLGDIEHVFERVAPGEEMPDGSCPECGALIHLEEEHTRDTIAAELDAHLESMAVKIEAVLRSEMEKWRARFPKRSMTFIDAMGSVNIDISDGPDRRWYTVTSHDCYRYQAGVADGAEVVVQPLMSLLLWYCELTDNDCRIAVDDIIIGEPFLPIHLADNSYRNQDPLLGKD